ncbi:alpha/beta hydrolase [Candidatus Woesebacteria bacterium]|nr:alpha/beta hydrolase [Candidatus Woesebacteria bacterium]
MEYIFTTTSDGLQLPGFYYPGEEKDVCILLVHGMSGFFLENYYGHVVGEVARKNGYGCIYTHNRGYAHINDIRTTEKSADGGFKTRRIGAVYERFEDCVLDIDAWLQKGRELGYKRFIIVGHSLGSPKIIHHFYTMHSTDVAGLVLASPGDMVGLVKKPEYQPNYLELLDEARQNVADGKPEELLSGTVWDWYVLSSQTFLDLFEEGGPADVLPIFENPEHFFELEAVDVPMLCIMGEYDDITIRTLEGDMQLLKTKATNAPSFTTHLLPGANHGYEGKEREFADRIVEWIRSL